MCNGQRVQLKAQTDISECQSSNSAAAQDSCRQLTSPPSGLRSVRCCESEVQQAGVELNVRTLRAMPKPHYAKRKSLPAAPPEAPGDDKEDEDMPDVLQRAQPDDISKPEVVFNTAQLPFGVLCSIYDELEKATRMKQKNKAETKGQMIEHFFKVQITSHTPECLTDLSRAARTAVEGAHRQRPVPRRPPNAARRKSIRSNSCTALSC